MGEIDDILENTEKDMKSNEVEQLSEREHVLKRPGRFMGSVEQITEARFLINENNKIKYENITYVPALIKLIQEIIDNSIDEAVRTNYKFSNKINVSIDENSKVVVEDNGRGIPVKTTIVKRDIIDPKTKQHKTIEEEHWQPDLAWTSLRAGANFKDEEDNTTIGQNGEGSTLVTIFSKEFIGETHDGSAKFILTCKDNMTKKEIQQGKSSKQFTRVSFLLDFPKLHLENIDEIHKRLLMTNIILLNICHPKIQFTFNGKKIEICKNFKHFLEKYFEGEMEIMEGQNLKVAVLPNPENEFNFIHIINGINVYDGGTPLDWATKQLLSSLVEQMKKKYKNISNGDIKSKLTFVCMFKNMVNPRFNTQTKSNCITTYSDFKEIVKDCDFEKLGKQIYKNESLINPIIQIYKIAEEFEKQKTLDDMSKSVKNVRIAKYHPAQQTNKYLVLAEGDSAIGSIESVLGGSVFGFFPLRGKSLNCYEADIFKVKDNVEIMNIIKILDLKLNNPNQAEMTYENVLIATDQDMDGMFIRGLLIAFFKRFVPNIIKAGKLKFLKTPILTLSDKSGNFTNYFFTIEEFKTFISNNNVSHLKSHYYKGLGSWKPKELKKLFTKEGLHKFIDTFEYDEDTDQLINDWFSKKTADVRKEYLRGLSFDISVI